MNPNTITPLFVSALIATRMSEDGVTEILNVLAHNKNKYGFPGGKLEKGETAEQAVIRETEEELSVTPTDVDFIATFESLTPEGRDITMHVFTGKLSDDIRPTNEIVEIRWLTHRQMVDRTSLLTPMTTEHIMPILEKL